VQNRTLITQKEVNTGASATVSLSERIQKKLQGISYLTIEKQSISNALFLKTNFN